MLQTYIMGNSPFFYINEYTYPLNTVEKPAIMAKVIAEAERNRVFPLGRWGEHMHYNSDVTVARAMEMAQNLLSS